MVEDGLSLDGLATQVDSELLDAGRSICQSFPLLRGMTSFVAAGSQLKAISTFSVGYGAYCLSPSGSHSIS